MSEKIEASDILGESAKKGVDDFNQSIQNTIIYIKQLEKIVGSMQKNPLENSSDIAKHHKEQADSLVLINKISAEKLKATKITLDALKTEEKVNNAAKKSLQDLAKETAKTTKEQANLNSVLEQTKKRYNDLSKAQMELSIRGRENGKVFKAIKIEADALRASLDKAEQGAGRFQRNVGNYKSGFNGLSSSVNQLTREMPAFANSMQTGFMAISNNLPIFFDEIKKTNDGLKELQATGQKTPSLLSTLGSALFSWGTLLSVGVTLLTVYGKELVSFIGDLFTASEANIKVIEDNNKAIDSIKENIKKLGDEYELLAQRKMKAEGVLSDMDIRRNEAFKRYSDLEEKQRKDLVEAAKAYTTEIGVYETSNITDRLEKRSELRRRLKELATSQQKELGNAARNLNAELAAIYIEANNEEEKRIKDANSKKVTVVKETKVKIIDLSKELRDAETNNITNSYDKQKAELTNKFNDDYEKYKENAALILELKTKLDSDLKAIDDKEIEDKEKILIELRKGQGDHDKSLKTAAETKAREAKALKDKEAQEDKARLQATFDFYDTINKAKQTKLEKELQADTDLRQRNILQQQALAMAGKDNTLAFEKAAAAKDELRKIELAKNEEKRLKAMAFIKLFAAYTDKGETDQALTKSLVQMAIVGAIMGSYFEGTENVGEDLKGNKVHNGRDGYHIAVDGSERILTGAQNKLIGDLSNDELAQVARAHNDGLLPKYITNNGSGSFAENLTNAMLLKQFTEMNSEIKDIKQVLKERPVNSGHRDENGDWIQKQIVNGITKQTRLKNNSPLNYI